LKELIVENIEKNWAIEDQIEPPTLGFMEGINDELALDAKITYEIEVNEKEKYNQYNICSLQRNTFKINKKVPFFEK
jgi:hypothetical protein